MAEELNKRLAKLKEERKKIPGEGRVIVKAPAYQKMLMHVLRFASNALPRDSWVEVMGMCIGRIEGDDVVVVDAVPVSHGSRIEVAWNPQDYALFASVDEQFAERGLFACGWYHSHPGLSIFWSKVDVRNQLGFQTEGNPKAFGIVFDHTTMDEPSSLGFKTYRLDDPARGVGSDYHEVETIVEPPGSLDFFSVTRQIIEAGQTKGGTFVKELSEEATWEAEAEAGEGAEEEEVESKSSSLLRPVTEGLPAGVGGFADHFAGTFHEQFATWAEELRVAVTKGGTKLADVVNEMCEGVEDGLSRVKDWFEVNFTEAVKEFESSVENHVREFSNHHKEVAKQVDELASGMAGALVSSLRERVEAKLGEVKEAVAGVVAKVERLAGVAGNLSDGLEKQGERVKLVVEAVPGREEKLGNALAELAKRLTEHVREVLMGPLADLEDLKSSNEKTAAAVKRLEEAVKRVKDAL
ncbi:MAG: hypothetical protein Kow0069_21160 [Promethearchaeota archaeon]